MPPELPDSSSQAKFTRTRSRRFLPSLPKFPRRRHTLPAQYEDPHNAVTTVRRRAHAGDNDVTPQSSNLPKLGVDGESNVQHPGDAPSTRLEVTDQLAEESAVEAPQSGRSYNDADEHASKADDGDVGERMDVGAVTHNEYQKRDMPEAPFSSPNVYVEEEKPKAMRRVLTKVDPRTRANRAETHTHPKRDSKINQPTPMDSQSQLVTARVGRSKTLSPFKRRNHQINQSIATAGPAQAGTTHVGRSKTLHLFKRNPRAVVVESQTNPAMHSLISDQPSASGALQSKDKDPPDITLCTGGDRLEPADAGAKQTAGESEEMEKLRRDLHESRSQVAELQKRCEAQSRDLETSNSFLSATDKSSDSDVINALQKLNAEVQQSTTFMADCLAERFEFKKLVTNTTEEQISAVRRVSETIGQVLAQSLGTNSPEYIPLLLPIAFQAYLVSALAQTASSWVFEQGHNKFINAIYQSLRGAEAQAVSGRWRVLARFHIVHAWVNHPEDLVKAIISGFTDILLATGCAAPRSDIMVKITSEFEPKIALLVELAVRLNKLFDEIVSSDFEILVVRPGEKFEDKNMQDADGDQIGAQDASVLCATHLGLMKRMPVGTLWERGKKQKLMVLKPKVLLASFLDTDDQ